MLGGSPSATPNDGTLFGVMESNINHSFPCVQEKPAWVHHISHNCAGIAGRGASHAKDDSRRLRILLSCHTCEVACQQEFYGLEAEQFGIKLTQIGPDQITDHR